MTAARILWHPGSRPVRERCEQIYDAVRAASPGLSRAELETWPAAWVLRAYVLAQRPGVAAEVTL